MTSFHYALCPSEEQRSCPPTGPREASQLGGGVGRSLLPSVRCQMQKAGPQESTGLSGGGSFGSVADKTECQKKVWLERNKRWYSPCDCGNPRTVRRAHVLFLLGFLHQPTRRSISKPPRAPRTVTHGGRREGPLKVVLTSTPTPQQVYTPPP